MAIQKKGRTCQRAQQTWCRHYAEQLEREKDFSRLRGRRV